MISNSTVAAVSVDDSPASGGQTIVRFDAGNPPALGTTNALEIQMNGADSRFVANGFDPDLRINGDGAANTLAGGDGDDTITGFGGADTITGGDGGDTIYGGTSVVDDANTTIDTETYGSGSISWNGTAWEVTSGSNVDTLHDIEHVVIGRGTALLARRQDGRRRLRDCPVRRECRKRGRRRDKHVLIATGSYAEQVFVNGAGSNGLTIETATGAGDVSIKAPNTEPLTTNGIIDPISNKDINAVVAVVNANDVTIRGITVDGDGQGALAVEGSARGKRISSALRSSIRTTASSTTRA